MRRGRNLAISIGIICATLAIAHAKPEKSSNQKVEALLKAIQRQDYPAAERYIAKDAMIHTDSVPKGAAMSRRYLAYIESVFAKCERVPSNTKNWIRVKWEDSVRVVWHCKNVTSNYFIGDFNFRNGEIFEILFHSDIPSFPG